MPMPKAFVAPVRGIFHPSAGVVIEVQPNNVAVLPDLFLVSLTFAALLRLLPSVRRSGHSNAFGLGIHI